MNENELVTLDINGNQHMLGFNPLSQDLYETIEPYMGHDFARYIQDKIEELQEKSDKEYWQNHSDEQVYEEELNEIHGFLNELWDYLDKIKSYGSKYKKMPDWGYIAIEAMDKMKEYM